MFKPMLITALITATSAAVAEYPSSFSNAKKQAERTVYFDHLTTFYCDCDYVFDDVNDLDKDGNKHETMVIPGSCGYEARKPTTRSGKPNARVSRIEWEHIMPAHLMGGHLDQWKNRKNYPECRKANGKYLTGRDCAYELVPSFKKAHDDMNNLTPAVGELNGDRSNYAFANISGEPRAYGACDFEVDFDKEVAEPANNIKGDIARTYFHMVKEHGVELDKDTQVLMLFWDKIDPVSEWECTKARRVEKAQNLGNNFVLAECK